MTIYDVGIVGGGPAGLSAALVLGRCCRSVVVFDHGKPRNQAARAVNCYLMADGLSPADFREAGRKQAKAVGADFIDAEVTDIRRLQTCFEIRTPFTSPLTVRKLLLATGTQDLLPDIENASQFYGKSVHHCPYCDGWEHRGQSLVAFGDGEEAFDLAIELQIWSPRVTACTNGRALARPQLQTLERNRIAYRFDRPLRLEGAEGRLREILFESGPPLTCDALFFAGRQEPRSPLAQMLGCMTDRDQHIYTGRKQRTSIRGVFVAGDADGDVQFAIVAAGEGAIAATAINSDLREDELHVRRSPETNRRNHHAQT